MRWQLSGRGGKRSPEECEDEADAVDYRHVLARSGETSRALSGSTRAASIAQQLWKRARLCTQCNNTAKQHDGIPPSIHPSIPPTIHLCKLVLVFVHFCRVRTPHFSINSNVTSEQFFKMNVKFRQLLSPWQPLLFYFFPPELQLFLNIEFSKASSSSSIILLFF